METPPCPALLRCLPARCFNSLSKKASVAVAVVSVALAVKATHNSTALVADLADWEDDFAVSFLQLDLRVPAHSNSIWNSSNTSWAPREGTPKGALEQHGRSVEPSQGAPTLLSKLVSEKPEGTPKEALEQHGRSVEPSQGAPTLLSKLSPEKRPVPPPWPPWWMFPFPERRRQRGGPLLPLAPSTQDKQLPNVDTLPTGSAIWNGSSEWVSVRAWHPVGVIANVHHGKVRWADVSYISLNTVLVLSAVAYPAFLVLVVLWLTFLVSMCLSTRPDYNAAAAEAVYGVPPGKKRGADPVYKPPVLPKECLTGRALKVYNCWAFFCCTIPSLMVFGQPLAMVGLARPYPQEVFSVLTLLTSAFIFSNGIHMVIFGSSSILRMRTSMKIDYSKMLQEGSAEGQSLERRAREQQRLGAEKAVPPSISQDVVHWIIMPQYTESLEVVSMALQSITRSSICRSSICVLLAMEEREKEAPKKAQALSQQFEGQFLEVHTCYHPSGQPNDPPGKASNCAFAFNHLVAHLKRLGGVDMSQVVLTVADADSEFSEGYFESLSYSFLMSDKRFLTIWQSPMLHLKNYHRQPALVKVGTLFTSMQELAALSDPNAVRLPYSTYSLSLHLARHVGGWDPDWIAEDYHMGIKCFLFTLGEARVEPILLPTVNYVPEDSTFWGTVWARWSQAKRHALGFSDVAYYFMMLPLIFGYAVNKAANGRISALHGFWRMATAGTTLLVRLVNVHVVIGVLSTYSVATSVLRLLMKLWFVDDRNVGFLFTRTSYCMVLLMLSSGLCTLIVALLFLSAYRLLRDRMEGEAYSSPLFHGLQNALCVLVFGPVYFLALGFAIWRAATNVLISRYFEYEVAKKPVSGRSERGRDIHGSPPTADTAATPALARSSCKHEPQN